MVRSSARRFGPLAINPVSSVLRLLHLSGPFSRVLKKPPPLTTSAAPAATSHSFFGTSVKVESASPAATRASLYATEPMFWILNPVLSKGFHSPRFTSLRLARTSAPLQRGPLARPRRFAVECHAGVERAQEQFIGGWIADSSRHRPAVLHHRHRNTEFRNARDKLARAVERIDHPDAPLVQSRQIVQRFFRQPAFAFAQQMLAQKCIDRPIGFGYRVVSGLIFGFNLRPQ